MKSQLSVSLLSASALVVAGCASTEPATVSTEPATVSSEPGTRTVIATTTVLGSVVSDITQCIGDDLVQTAVLMPIGADPHEFAPSSEQVALMSESGLVVANGLGLEQGLVDVLDQVEADGGVVYHVAEWVDPLPFAADEHDHAEDEHDHAEDEHAEDEHDHAEDEHDHAEDEHDHGEFDPHFWFDMERMADVARALGAEWEAEFGSDAVSCGEQVAASIEQADSEVQEILGAIPAQNRVLVTDHQAFNYFAERYEFRVAGAVIPGGSTLAEPSSQELSELVQTILDEGVSAVVSNRFEPSAVLDSVAEEGGEITVIPLYVGSIGEPEGDASDYQTMMITNARLLAEALS